MLWYVISLNAVFLSIALYYVHQDIHEQNTCGMTFMWRYIYLPPIPVRSNNVSSYGMYRYHEGSQEAIKIQPGDIPVLFVPGSGGSAKQIRSIASVMLNKTDTQRPPFRMHFYAVDFMEELTFLSGDMLHRQRNFVVQAIKYLHTLYGDVGMRKMILIGHSFGGVVVRSLPAHPEFDVSKVDLMIMLAAPLRASPIVMDESMAKFYREVYQIWEIRKSALAHIGVISYSGGVKDFQVPDRLASLPEQGVVHLPSWSIRGVDLAADHLCILWCNQIVRHVTRLLFQYGNAHINVKEKSGKDIVDEFYTAEFERSAKPWKFSLKDAEKVSSSSPTTGEDLKIFDNPAVPWKYKNKLENTEVMSLSLYLVKSVAVQVNLEAGRKCAKAGGIKLAFEYPSGKIVEARKKGREMKLLVTPQLKAGRARVLLQGARGCAYQMSIAVDPFATFYLTFVDNAHMFIRYSILCLMILAVLQFSFDIDFVFSHPVLVIGGEVAVIMTVPFLLYMNCYIFEGIAVYTVVVILSILIFIGRGISTCLTWMAAWFYSILPYILLPFVVATVFCNSFFSCGLVAMSCIKTNYRHPYLFMLSYVCAFILLPMGMTTINLARSLDTVYAFMDGNISEHAPLVLAAYPVLLFILLKTFVGAVLFKLFAIGTYSSNFASFLLRAMLCFTGFMFLLAQIYARSQSLEVIVVASTTVLVIADFISSYAATHVV